MRLTSLADLGKLLPKPAVNESVNPVVERQTMNDSLSQAIWKVMADRRARSTQEIVNLLINPDYDYNSVNQMLEIRSSEGWFTKNMVSGGITRIEYRLKNGVQMPQPIMQHDTDTGEDKMKVVSKEIVIDKINAALLNGKAVKLDDLAAQVKETLNTVIDTTSYAIPSVEDIRKVITGMHFKHQLTKTKGNMYQLNKDVLMKLTKTQSVQPVKKVKKITPAPKTVNEATAAPKAVAASDVTETQMSVYEKRKKIIAAIPKNMMNRDCITISGFIWIALADGEYASCNDIRILISEYQIPTKSISAMLSQLIDAKCIERTDIVPRKYRALDSWEFMYTLSELEERVKTVTTPVADAVTLPNETKTTATADTPIDSNPTEKDTSKENIPASTDGISQTDFLAMFPDIANAKISPSDTTKVHVKTAIDDKLMDQFHNDVGSALIHEEETGRVRDTSASIKPSWTPNTNAPSEISVELMLNGRNTTVKGLPADIADFIKMFPV